MLYKIGQWLLRRLGGSALVLGLTLGAAGFWMYFKETLSLEEQRTALLQTISGERSHLLKAQELVEQRRQHLVSERVREETNLRNASAAAKSLGELHSTWESLFGDREQQHDYSRRRDLMEEQAEKSRKHIEELTHLITLEDYTRDGLDLALGKLAKRSEQAVQEESKLIHYLRSAWMEVRWHLLSALLIWLLGPVTLRLIGYYLLAPWVSRRRPIRFADAQSALPSIEESRVALEMILRPGETLRIRGRNLQASDEGLRKRTRFIFDWRFPFTSIACHLTEMMDLEHDGGPGPRHVTISDSKDPLCEVSILRIPEGASLILRPSAIAGIVIPSGEAARIRPRWLFSRVQAWMTLQFRYFEFEGPQQILIAGSRGIRVETLGSGEFTGARRVNASTIIGFSPTLDYRPVRAETFWAYHRGQNALFDELFSGRGIFVCQASTQEEAQSRSFWSGLGQGLMRVLGF